MLTQEKLKEILHYNPETGEFVKRIDRTRVEHKVAKGYLGVSVLKTQYRAHRLAWFYMTGEWPPEQIDHINGVRDDNRWENLRLATKSQNSMNTPLSSTNTSGVKGVGWNVRRQLWGACVKVDGKRKIAHFSTRKEAEHWVRQKRSELHGEFARHG